jgi:hypothetical protein
MAELILSLYLSIILPHQQVWDYDFPKELPTREVILATPIVNEPIKKVKPTVVPPEPAKEPIKEPEKVEKPVKTEEWWEVYPLTPFTIEKPTELEQLVNEQREPILVSSCIREAAYERAKEIVENDKLSHERPNGERGYQLVRSRCAPHRNAGEAIGQDIFGESLVQAWMNSPTHKAVILGNYTHFGIGQYGDVTVLHLVDQSK